MPETPLSKYSPPDPRTDIFLCRLSPASSGPAPRPEECTLLFAHQGSGETTGFYLSYQDDPSDPPVICPFESPLEAAAFILGMAGSGLDKIPEPEKHRIRKYFPGWFDPAENDEGDDADDSTFLCQRK
jgi:hypothetical protein